MDQSLSSVVMQALDIFYLLLLFLIINKKRLVRHSVSHENEEVNIHPGSLACKML